MAIGNVFAPTAMQDGLSSKRTKELKEIAEYNAKYNPTPAQEAVNRDWERQQAEEKWAAEQEEKRRQERVEDQAKYSNKKSPNTSKNTETTGVPNILNPLSQNTGVHSIVGNDDNPINKSTNVGQSSGYSSSAGTTTVKAEVPAPTASNSNPKLTQTPTQTPAETYYQNEEVRRQAEEAARQAELKRKAEEEAARALEQRRQYEARQAELARQRDMRLAESAQAVEEAKASAGSQSQEETPEGQQALANQQAQQANDMALREAALRNDPFANFRVGEPEEQRYDARYPKTTTAPQTTGTTNALQEWVNREYPEYTGDQSPAFIERNWYRGRELMQPYTTAQQVKDAIKVGNSMTADKDDDDEFYTIKNTEGDGLDDVLGPWEDRADAANRYAEKVNNVINNTPEQYRQGYEYDYPAKIGMGLINRWNTLAYQNDVEGQRLDWITSQPEYLNAKTDAEKIAAMRELLTKYDMLIEQGDITLPEAKPIVTSNQVRDNIDAFFEGASPEAIRSRDEANALYQDALKAAAQAGINPNNPEGAKFIADYIAVRNKEILPDENPFGVTESTGNSGSSGVGNVLNSDQIAGLVSNAQDTTLNYYLQHSGRSLEDLGDDDAMLLHEMMRDARKTTYDQLAPAYTNEFVNGDARNIPAELMASVYESVTGDTAYANEMAQEYERFKGMGMNDRQISAELYRRAAEHNNPLARATDAEGNLHFDLALAGTGLLPEEIAVPKVNADGTGNEAYNTFVNSVNYYDDSGMSLWKGDDGNYYTGVPQADGSVKREQYKGDVTSVPQYSFEDMLSMYINPNAGKPGESTWRGLDDLFDGLTEGERKGMEELLANFVRGGDLGEAGRGLNGENEDRGDQYKTEFADMTQEEYDRLVSKFLNKMPAISGLIDNGVLLQDDVENFFFKNIQDSNGNPMREGTSSSSPYGKTKYFTPSYGQDMSYGVKLPYGKYTEADLQAAGNRPYTDANGRTQYEGYYYWNGSWYPVDQEKAAYYQKNGGSYDGWDEGMREYYNTFGTFYGYRPDWKTAGGKNTWKNNTGGRSYNYSGGNYSSGGNSSNYSRGGWSYGGNGNTYVNNYNGYGNGNSSYSSNGNAEQAQLNPSAKNQKQNRIYNIMKNWSF